MTGEELQVLIGFLVGGSLAGIVGRWLDTLVTYMKGR